ncbi:MAG: Single-stranded-DNA-specific exonuclease RecJ [Pelotomaculum sp. PtaU1.Bin035]|nr:MAG: Single-stranded-DNA-specific exonuclease RecJ [Pelotomaculum sp. PtaU1.Bin035]
MKKQKIWRVKTPAPALQHILAREMGISTITAQLLINRGIYTVEQCHAFFDCELERLHDPFLLRDMGIAVKRIFQAAGAGEKILIYGDYDADGITAAVLLVQVIRRLGARVEYYIPNRMEDGYGLHLDPLQRYREKGTSLVVTVDCGISAVEESAWAEESGLTLIITDHHEPPPMLPRALAIINPKRQDCSYPFKDLAGVGVALKLAQALLDNAGVKEQAWLDYLDLVCLGTIADIVPLHGENRILVRHGLPRLLSTTSPGLNALKKVSGFSKDILGTNEVGFRIAPRLNAAGRIGDPDMAARLLLANNVGEAWELANELHRNNQARQEIESAVLEEALKLLEERPELAEGKVIVLASAGWHPGVIGIVASRLVDRFYRPVLLISLDSNPGKGSARSIPDFNIYKALSYCKEYLISFGGHALAAGFSISTDGIEVFYRAINQYADIVINKNQMIPRLDLDGIIDMRQVSEELVEEINLLQPFGPNNPSPLLGCQKASVLSCRGVGRDSIHLKMSLRSEGVTVDSIGYNLGAYAEVLATNEAVDLAFVPGMNEYNGRRSVQLEVKDLARPAVLEFSGQEDIKAASTQSLPEESGELFIPEFILTIHKNIEKTKVVRPSYNNLCTKNGRVEFVDLRGPVERLVRLAELIAGEEHTVVITACGYQTIEIAHYLQQAFPALKGKIAFCHNLLSKDVLSDCVETFERGELIILVTTPVLADSLGINAGQVVICQLPYNQEIINFAANAVKSSGRAYQFIGKDDFENNLAYLETMAPGWECLARVYTMLRRKVNGNGQLTLDPSMAARALAKSGPPQIRDYTVSIALKILSELELVVIREKGKSIQIRLLPAPRDKKDLASSQTYLQLHQIKNESIAWMTNILTGTVNDII